MNNFIFQVIPDVYKGETYAKLRQGMKLIFIRKNFLFEIMEIIWILSVVTHFATKMEDVTNANAEVIMILISRKLLRPVDVCSKQKYIRIYKKTSKKHLPFF